MALGLLIGWTAMGLAQSRDHIGYWRDKYQELAPTSDARVANARRIFEQLVQVAGTRLGKTPQLFIADRDPWDIPLPIALPDGWIILSKGVLDLCYRDQTQGDDRLAFVLAHELAHQLNGDLGHLRYFQALVAAHPDGRVRDGETQASLATALHIASDREVVRARELQADRDGILYAAMAGFNSRAIVTGSQHAHFFTEWVRALETPRPNPVATDRLTPTPQERAQAVLTQLRPVADNADVFQLGLWFYYAGDYPRAQQAFTHFRAVFPSREVLHNLAASHHQLALQAYQVWQDAVPIPVHLSLTIDPLTRASRIYLEGPSRGGTATPGSPAAYFRKHLQEAIQLYREALTHDPAYTPAALNLGDALIVLGLQRRASGSNADLLEAATILERARESTPDAPVLLNSLGVALWYVGQRQEALDHLRRARRLAPTYAAPEMNLTYLEQSTHQPGDAAPPVTSSALPSTPTLSQPRLSVLGLTIGSTEADIPAQWQRPAKRTVRVGQETYTMATYPTGVQLLIQDGEIRMLMVREGYQELSPPGLPIGSTADTIRARYGMPTRQVELTQGQNWGYDAQRLAVQLRDRKVVSWLVY